MKLHTVSIIVAIYNVEDYLGPCVKSLLAQTYREIEIVLVDDGSPDSCGRICDDFALQDDRVRVLHKDNGGLSDARNAGLQVASGRYIVYVDGDDIVDNRFIELLVQPLIDEKADISICDAQLIANSSCYKQVAQSSFEVMDADSALVRAFCMNGMNLSAWGKLASKRLWESHLFPKGRVYEDLATIPSLLRDVGKVVHVKAAIYGQVERPGSITRQKQVTERQLRDYYLAAQDAFDAGSESGIDSVAQAANIRRLISYARIKRLLRDVDKSSEYVEELGADISFSLRAGFPIAVASGLLSFRNAVLLFVAAYCAPAYRLLDLSNAIIKRVKRVLPR